MARTVACREPTRDGRRAVVEPGDGTQCRAATVHEPPARACQPLAVGVVVWLASELMFFGGLFAAYYTLRSSNAVWPPPGVELDTCRGRSCSPSCCWRRASRCTSPSRPPTRGDRAASLRWLFVTFVLGTAFLVNLGLEWAGNDFTLTEQRLRLDLLPAHRLPRPARARRPGADDRRRRGGERHGLARCRSARRSRSAPTTGTSSTSSGSGVFVTIFVVQMSRRPGHGWSPLVGAGALAGLPDRLRSRPAPLGYADRPDRHPTSSRRASSST